jgi:hypothetical protein
MGKEMKHFFAQPFPGQPFYGGFLATVGTKMINNFGSAV